MAQGSLSARVRAMARVRVAVVSVLCLVLVCGCGFQLRGWDLDESIGTVFVSSADGSESAGTELGAELRTAFAQAGVTVASTSGEADLVVSLLDQRRQRRSVSVTGQARAAEYELSREVHFSVDRISTEQRERLIEPRWIRVERVFRVDRNNIVGNNEEQALVERELKNDIIQQIIRSINLVVAAEPTSTEQGG